MPLSWCSSLEGTPRALPLRLRADPIANAATTAGACLSVAEISERLDSADNLAETDWEEDCDDSRTVDTEFGLRVSPCFAARRTDARGVSGKSSESGLSACFPALFSSRDCGRSPLSLGKDILLSNLYFQVSLVYEE